MAEQFSIPEEYQLPIRRLLAYLSAPLQNNPEVLSSLMLYMRMGGDKLARAAIEAFNISHRLKTAELKKLLRQEALDNLMRETKNEDQGTACSDDKRHGEDGKRDADQPVATEASAQAPS